MPQIPTHTANLTTPREGRGADEISLGAALAPGVAMERLGHELLRAGAIAGNLADQRTREIELRYAADAGQRFTEDSIRWQQEFGNREDSGEAFKAWSDQRIGELQKEAPSGRAGQIFKQHVLPQANSDWRHNLARGEAVRLSNFKVGEESASQASQEAMHFRYREFPDHAEMLRTTDLRMQLNRINSAYGTTAPANAAAMSEQAVVSAVLGAAEHNPAFARQLLDDFPLVDVPKREELLRQIKTAQAQQGQAALFDMTQSWESAFKVAQAQGKPAPAVPDEKLFVALGGEQGRRTHEQMQEEAVVQNTAVGTIRELKGWNGGAAASKLAEMTAGLQPDEGSKADGLRAAEQWLVRSWDLQQKDPAAWQVANQGPITSLDEKAREAYRQADSLPDGQAKSEAMARAAMIRDRQFTLQKFYQGPAPASASPAQSRLFLNLAQTHIVSKETAEHYADQINQAGPEERIKLARGLKAQYGAHSSDFFADLATLPGAGRSISPALIQGLNIQNDRHAAAYMQAQVGKKAEDKLDQQTLRDYTTALESNPDWSKYMKGWIGEYNQRGPFMESAREGLLNYAVALRVGSMASDAVKDATGAVKMALDHVVTAQIGMANVNGRVVPMARETRSLPGGQIGPVLRTRSRTDEEVQDVERGLSILLRSINPTEIDRGPFVSAPPGEPGADFIMRRIWTNGYYVTDHDGQSATLYVPGDDGPIQVRDKDNRPLRVVFDEVPAFTTTRRLTFTQSAKQHRNEVVTKQQPGEFESAYGKKTNTVMVPSSTRDELGDIWITPGRYVTTNTWNWPTTSRVFRR